MSGAAADGVGLAAVLGDVRVNERDDVGTDGGSHDVREGDVLGGLGLDGDEGAGGGGHWSVEEKEERRERSFETEK